MNLNDIAKVMRMIAGPQIDEKGRHYHGYLQDAAEIIELLEFFNEHCDSLERSDSGSYWVANYCTSNGIWSSYCDRCIIDAIRKAKKAYIEAEATSTYGDTDE